MLHLVFWYIHDVATEKSLVHTFIRLYKRTLHSTTMYHNKMQCVQVVSGEILSEYGRKKIFMLRGINIVITYTEKWWNLSSWRYSKLSLTERALDNLI